jgi:sorting nexin-25
MDVIGLETSKNWRGYAGAAFVLLAALYTASSRQSIDLLSYRSIAVLVVTLIVVSATLCLGLAIVVPIWLAWLTDTRLPSNTSTNTSPRRVDLTGARQAMAVIQQTLQSEKQDIHPTSRPVSTVIDDLLSLIMRDFVEEWHDPLVSGDSQSSSFDSASSRHFPAMVEATIRTSISNILKRASAIDLAQLGMCELLPIVTRHAKLFEQAESEWRRSPSAVEFADGIEGDLFLAALYDDGNLHPAVGNIASPDTKLTELVHLRRVAERAMKHVLPEQEAKSAGVHIVIRELIACTIMKPIVDTFSDPDNLNALLEEKATAALREQKLVSKLREALDKQGSLSSTSKAAGLATSSSPTFRKKKVDPSSEASYDSFIDSIGQSKSILDARRTRNGLLLQIRKTKAALAEDEGQAESKKKDLQVYLHRMQAALVAVDDRLIQLGTAPENLSKSKMASSEFADSLELRDILTSSAAISYFLEFAESKKCSILVQFWLSVNTFKNPLEVAESESEDESDAIAGRLSSPTATSAASMQLASETEAKTLTEDLKFFVDTYYHSNGIKEVIKAVHVGTAEDYLQRYSSGQVRPSVRVIRQIRKSVLRAQKQVYEELVEGRWPVFKRSPVWHQTVEALQRERLEQVPTVTSSSSFFMNHKDIPRDAAPRPSTSRAVTHAHLFGMSNEGQEKSPTTSFFTEENDERPFRHLEQTTSGLDQLMGGKGVTFGVTQRDPLFREALFDDDEDGIEGHEEKAQNVGKEAIVRVDKVDALEDVLAFIIEEDLPLNHDRIQRPALGERRKSSANVKSRIRSPLLGGEESAAISNPKSGDQLLQPALSRNDTVDFFTIDVEIKRLSNQEDLISALMRKAELTGSSDKEMMLLQKSKTTIAREMRELHFQRKTLEDQQQDLKQYEVQVDSNRVHVRIQHAQVNHDIDGKEYASYLIEVSHLAEAANQSKEKELIPQSGWIVSRRYNEFYALHNRLKEQFAQVRALESVFPGKRFNGLVNATFLESRRISLQRYLQNIMKLDEVCNSIELKQFLSQSIVYFTVDALDSPESATRGSSSSKGFASRFYRGVTGVAEGLDDLLFGPSMYEVIIHRLSTGVTDLVGFNEMERILAGSTTSSAAEIKEATQANNTSSFTGPLCDAIIELFQLKLEGNWFRKQAVIIVAQQALGGTIERRVRQSIATALEPSALLRSISLVRTTIWPNGNLKKQTEEKRSPQEKIFRSENALKKLSTLIPSRCSHCQSLRCVFMSAFSFQAWPRISSDETMLEGLLECPGHFFRTRD